MKEFATCAHAIRGTTGGAQQNKLAAPAASALEVIRRQPKSEVHPMTDRYDTAQPQAHALMGREGCLPAPAFLCMVIEEVLSWFAEPSGRVQPDHGFNTHVSSDVR